MTQEKLSINCYQTVVYDMKVKAGFMRFILLNSGSQAFLSATQMSVVNTLRPEPQTAYEENNDCMEEFWQ